MSRLGTSVISVLESSHESEDHAENAEHMENVTVSIDNNIIVHVRRALGDRFGFTADWYLIEEIGRRFPESIDQVPSSHIAPLVK